MRKPGWDFPKPIAGPALPLLGRMKRSSAIRRWALAILLGGIAFVLWLGRK